MTCSWGCGIYRWASNLFKIIMPIGKEEDQIPFLDLNITRIPIEPVERRARPGKEKVCGDCKYFRSIPVGVKSKYLAYCEKHDIGAVFTMGQYKGHVGRVSCFDPSAPVTSVNPACYRYWERDYRHPLTTPNSDNISAEPPQPSIAVEPMDISFEKPT